MAEEILIKDLNEKDPLDGEDIFIVEGVDGVTKKGKLVNIPAPATIDADTIVDGSTKKAYTAAEKTKLAGVAANANNYTLPATLSADIIIDGSANKAYTAAEKTKLAGLGGSGSSDGFISAIIFG